MSCSIYTEALLYKVNEAPRRGYTLQQVNNVCLRSTFKQANRRIIISSELQFLVRKHVLHFTLSRSPWALENAQLTPAHMQSTNLNAACWSIGETVTASSPPLIHKACIMWASSSLTPSHTSPYLNEHPRHRDEIAHFWHFRVKSGISAKIKLRGRVERFSGHCQMLPVRQRSRGSFCSKLLALAKPPGSRYSTAWWCESFHQ